MFLVSLNYFRAIAIVFIVAGHSYKLVGITHDSLFQNIILNLITGGTTLFVFISGFLFHHIFSLATITKPSKKNKIKNVLIPYLVLSMPIIYWITLKGDGWWGPYFNPNSTGVSDHYVIPTVQYLLSGSHMVAYWYIPFIIVTFSMPPIHRWFDQQNTLIQLAIIIFYLAISAILHRPLDTLYVFQSVLYFSRYT